MPTFVRSFLVVAALAASGCAQLEPRPELPPATALAVGSGTALDRAVADAEARHPGESAFRLIREGPEAFAVRAVSARMAGRSLDIQTYIWHADQTGAFLAHVALEAADRGVQVRLLVDDMDARAKNYGYAALDAHPNIEARMFNPFASREGTFSAALEGISSYRRINRRMHNKTWIADNRIAIVGGRNLGDEYFGASDEINFVDLDFAMIGPIVRDASASFDRYWNSPLAYPMTVLAPAAVSLDALQALREQLAPRVAQARTSRYAELLRRDDAVQRLIEGDWPMQWSANYRFVADDPRKAAGETSGAAGSDVVALLGPLSAASRERLTIVSPYFVPGETGTAAMVRTDVAGSRVRVLTNSLAANDVALVYGGYSKWRTPLLEGGVEIWELKPTPGQVAQSSLFGSSGASLHTKALAVDDRVVFVGSYNLDPRSTSLNCEQGIFVESPAMATQLEQMFAIDTAGDRAWSVTLDEGQLRWNDGQGTYERAPEASIGRRFQAWLAKVLPIDSQL
jgi:putative cardiolipin synthase